jgi:hypothetical protein
MPELVWVGSPTAKCDLCPRPLTTLFYDARTRDGRWGFLCHTCFRSKGTGLGNGQGQKYRKRDDGKFVKVAG